MGPVKKTSNDANDPTKSPEPTGASEPEEVVTGTDGAVVTYTPTKDPEHSDLAETLTTTDGDDGVTIIFPGGWKGPPRAMLRQTALQLRLKSLKAMIKTTMMRRRTLLRRSRRQHLQNAQRMFLLIGREKTTWLPRLGDCLATSGCVAGEQSTTITYALELVPRNEMFEPLGGTDESNNSRSNHRTVRWEVAEMHAPRYFSTSGMDLSLIMAPP